MKTAKQVKQAGRPTTQPEELLNDELAGLDILAGEFHDVLKELDAPLEWHGHLEFMVTTLIFPNRVKTGQVRASGRQDPRFRFAVTLPPIKPPPSQPPYGLLDAIRFGHLYSQSPEKFLRCMLGLKHVLDTRLNSPEIQVANILDAWPESWLMKAEDVADEIKKRRKHLPRLFDGMQSVTPKIVEHARAKLRQHKGFQFPPQS